MKTSMFLAASGAILAAANPLNAEKRAVTTELIIEWKTVFVTENVAPTAIANGILDLAPKQPAATTSAAPIPTPEPEIVAPAPDPTTAPVVITTTISIAPKVEATVAAAPAPSVAESAEAAPAAPVASTVQAQAAEPTDYASTAVYHHNLHRMNYSAPALEWSQTYADYAAQTAANCKFAHDL